ncbi:MAG: ABC transporter permease [Acidobacteria bacterium]|nr:ABC transporter permease [Acidobacteriota bacterium]MCI0720851.1 ABC transporter permease [Acidobacteriota bacterium]
MAWRDSRSSRRRLLLFVSSITLGVAALMAISSFGVNLRQGLDHQAKTLLGADLVIRARQPFSEAAERLFDSIGGEQARETSFSSMVLFPKNTGTRLAQVRALEGAFPFFGEMETEPVDAALAFTRAPRALVEDGLMLQFNATVGDEIRIGAYTYRIAGRLKKVPGESAAAGILGARVYIPKQYLSQTRLLQRGSAATYKVYFRLPKGVNAEQLVKKLQSDFIRLRLDSETVEERKANLGRSLENAYDYLNLVAFIALLLGSIGVASSVHVYIKQKVNTLAVLRCLGAKSRSTFAIYLIQTSALGLIGAVGGVLLGLAVQYLLPKVMQDFLPVSIPFFISWVSLVQAMVTGFGIALLFSLLPLLGLRRVSPLLAIRASYEEGQTQERDLWRWLLYTLILISVTAFSMAHTRRWIHGIWFTLGLVAALGLLAAMARLIRFSARRLMTRSWSYIWRQGLANLYRPNNQTLVLMLSIGLGTFLMMTLYLIHSVLVQEVTLLASGRQPNMVLFDVQTDQRPELRKVVESLTVPILQEVPIVTMRLASVQGKPVEDILKDPRNSIPESALQREYRSTYRDKLISTEKLTLGKWQPQATPGTGPILVSLEEGIAKRLKVKLGDELVFDVQGLPVATQVGSLRKVEWERVQPNFFVVFPAGVLEDAPQFYVMVLRTRSNEESARLQQTVVQKFANVSAIDLALIVNMIDSILSKVSFVVRFMALFSIFTGLVVLAGAVITGRYQRIRESVLLRTMGAKKRQVLQIMLVEYFFLGTLAALTGLLLAWAGSWALAQYVFEAPFVPVLLPSLLALLVVTALAVAIGMLNSRGIASRPPLEVLRAEA